MTGKELIALGFPQGPAIGEVLKITRNLAKTELETLQPTLTNILSQPLQFEQDNIWAPVAKALIGPPKDPAQQDLLPEAKAYEVYGPEGIEAAALRQIDTAMRLPITRAGALMADAHYGYGLPIGGVLATENAVIPYGVGVDIGCRMCMSVLPIAADQLDVHREDWKSLLLEHTRFGKATFRQPREHEVLDRPLFNEIAILKQLQRRAYSQIGSSGGGNHFVEFGITEILDANNEFGLPLGEYVAILSHSGSRGLGANIAAHYTKKARDVCKLPDKARHLAWLELSTELGQEYWQSMNLAGDYASACHHQIHDRLTDALGESALTRIENHHNFAWKEKDAEGREIIVHRKGATPAGKGVLGIIPGSMTAPGFIVRGKGHAASINSASHGAGRVMSRTQAKKRLRAEQVKASLQAAGVSVIGSGLDEAPMAYKDIHQVMAAQEELVDIIGTFLPKIVRMCGEEMALEEGK